MSDNPEVWARWLHEIENEDHQEIIFDGSVDVLNVVIEENDINLSNINNEELSSNRSDRTSTSSTTSYTQGQKIPTNLNSDNDSSHNLITDTDTPKQKPDNRKLRRRVIIRDESFCNESNHESTNNSKTLPRQQEEKDDENWIPISSDEDSIISIPNTPKKKRRVNNGTSSNESHRTPTKPNTSQRSQQTTPGKTLTPSRSDNDSNASIADTPPKKRNRFPNPDNWARNVRKNRRAAGLEYTTPQGEIRPAKQLIPIVQHKCRFNCANNFSVEQQQELFDNFMLYRDVTRKKDYICSLVSEVPVKRKRKRDDDSVVDRAVSREHYLMNTAGERVRVCQKFFCDVFRISKAIITAALQFKSPQGSYTGRDRRKGRPATNATPQRIVKKIESFLHDFPKIPSHYCRARSSRLYLAPDLNITKLFKMYGEKYPDDKEIVTYHVFRDVFNHHDPPLSVFIPKKDQCVTCNVAEREGTVNSEIHAAHLERKEAIKKMKADDKKEAENNKNIIYAAFDLQAVLTLPYSEDSQLYYKRKLTMYNFTVYDNRKMGFCYTWDETEGRKGSAEIGTCLLKYIEALPSNIEKITFYCDTCGGQNRNQNVMAAFLYAVNKTSEKNLRTIDLKFMESGHSYLEADGMHGAIERCRKGKTFYLPHDYRLLMKLARKDPSPYNVYELKNRDFFDLQLLAQQVVTNRNKTTSKGTLKWLHVKWFQFSKGTNLVGFKYDVTGDFDYVAVSQESLDWTSIKLVQKYNELFPISIKKKKDLLSLIRTGVIPSAYAAFYRDLPSSAKAKDEPTWERGYNPDQDYKTSEQSEED